MTPQRLARYEDAEFMLETGEHPLMVSARLGISRSGLEKLLLEGRKSAQPHTDDASGPGQDAGTWEVSALPRAG